MQMAPWQTTKAAMTAAPSHPGCSQQPIYKLDTDRDTGERRLKVDKYYDIQEYIDSYKEDANPIALAARVKMGIVNRWDGSHTYDQLNLPRRIEDMPRYTAKLIKSREAQIINKIKNDMEDNNGKYKLQQTEPIKEPVTES